MAYGFSVFWLPLSKALGIKQAIACGPEVGFFQELFDQSLTQKLSYHVKVPILAIKVK